MSSPAESSRVRPSAFGCITLPFLLLALLPLLWGARANWRAGELERRGTVVDGRVIELRHVPSNPTVRSQRSSTASPVVRFTTAAGESRVAVGSVNRGPVPWRVGDTVAIVYDPQEPARADLHSEVAGWRVWLVVWCVVALVPLAIALAPVVLLVRERRRRTTPH